MINYYGQQGGDDPFIEESGMMNIMFVINDRLITAPLSDSILDGVTRDSLLTLANDLGYKTEERSISVKELEVAFKNKTITEAFGAGTAAVVAPVETISINNTDYHLPKYSHENIMTNIKQRLSNIRTGEEIDNYGWNYVI
ncbi:MAG: aminotransferase class IV [Chitinophagaceae bacterium]